MRKNKGIIQLVAIIITGLLCYSSIYVYAADTIPQGYTGIYDAQDLAAVNDNLDGKYILMNDIDLSTYGDWTPIGKYTGFSGVLDGNGYYIKNMQIGDETVYEDAGLFTTLQGATVKNLRVSGTINCDETPTLNVGAIAGQAYDSIIYRCGSYVNITYKDGESDGSSYTTAWERLCAGGIVGATWGNTKIEECFNANKVTGTATSTPLNIGGIVGWFSENTTINNCFNMADVSGNTGYVEIALGGIVGGQFSATKCLIQNSYSVGQVTGSHGKWKFDRSHIGGILGDCGNDDRTVISNCYYYSAAHTAVGVVRRLKSEGYDVDIIVDAKACEYTEMQKKSTYAGFDFTNVWKAGTSTSPFPILRWTSGNSSCSHTYTSAGGNICTSCGYEFKPELVEYNKTMYSTINNVAVRNQPYAKGGTLVKKLAKGEAVKVTHYFYNALGSKWYITSDGNYIFGDYLTLTGVKKHTLTFNANGSGVTNLPETAHIQEGVRMAIPGKASGIPERAGYTFIGYSTDKNSTTAEYVPGRSIKLTEDTTLYAIWVKNKIASAQELVDYALSFSGKTRAECIEGGLQFYSGGWCAMFVSACAQNSGLSDIIPYNGNPKALYNAIIKAGGTSVTSPQVGDIVFFDWGGSSFNSKKGFDHVGIVSSVKNGKIYVVHGNYHSSKPISSVCSEKGCKYSCSGGSSWKIDCTEICAYARPNWQ